MPQKTYPGYLSSKVEVEREITPFFDRENVERKLCMTYFCIINMWSNSLCDKNMAFSYIFILMLTTGKTHFTLNFKLQKTCLTAIGWYLSLIHI